MENKVNGFDFNKLDVYKEIMKKFKVVDLRFEDEYILFVSEYIGANRYRLSHLREDVRIFEEDWGMFKIEVANHFLNKN